MWPNFVSYNYEILWKYKGSIDVYADRMGKYICQTTMPINCHVIALWPDVEICIIPRISFGKWFICIAYLAPHAYNSAQPLDINVPYGNFILSGFLPSQLSTRNHHDLTLMPAWISNRMSCKVWDEITYHFPNFNGTTVEVWESIKNLHHTL